MHKASRVKLNLFGKMNTKNPFKYFKNSPEVIRLTIMYYIRYSLSLRQVEDILHERGIEISHETVRYWWRRFSDKFAKSIQKKRRYHHSNWSWHLDEVFVKIKGKRYYLWRAVDHEGEVLEAYVSKKRNKKAALKFLRKIIRRYGKPEAIITDRMASYKAALRELSMLRLQKIGRYLNNRAENSHLIFRRRERAMKYFKSMRSLQQFASIQSHIYNHFNKEKYLSNIKTSRYMTNPSYGIKFLVYLGKIQPLTSFLG